ncbi:MAG: hypothetical protein RLZZ214_2903 [Verrucomicrobiota bacterium]|jgi:hypothetical protein
MTIAASSGRRGDGRLWAFALGLSLLLNGGILLLAGLASLKSQQFRKEHPVAAPVPAETTVMIFPDIAKGGASPEPPPPATVSPEYVRTSEDQAAARPEKAPFIGERDTQATSDRAPDPTAPALPSQSGIAPKNPGDLETTESRYQDGRMESNQPAKPQEPVISKPTPPTPTPDPALADNPAPGETQEAPGKDDSKSTPSPREALMEGPNPVDVPVPLDSPKSAEIKPTPPKSPKSGKPAPAPAELPKPAVAKSATDPGFRGYQRKTAIVGSISRTGRSALDVADTPLGRYQAIISRAVEQEWQRNCVRHRDFITPGFLTVRFFVETSGKVRTVQFVGSMETGEVQKGFTLNSIRNAGIPPMPAALKKDFEKEPLELIFNFYF